MEYNWSFYFFKAKYVWKKQGGMFKVHESDLGTGSFFCIKKKKKYLKCAVSRLYFKFRWNKMAGVNAISEIFIF